MTRHTYNEYYPGDHLVICDRCGTKRYRSDCKKEWQGHIVCTDTCWEPRHPQDITPPYRLDRQWVDDNRPRAATDEMISDASYVSQDFTEYQEDDASARFTVAASQVDVDLYENSEAKLVKDFGLSYFQDFKIRLTAQGFSSDAGTDSAAMLLIVGKGNAQGADYWGSLLPGVGIWCEIGTSAFKLRAIEFAGNGNRHWVGDEISVAYNTDQFLQFERQAGVLYLKRYSDATFTTLLETQSESLYMAGWFRYLICPTLIYTGGVDNDATFQITNLAVETYIIDPITGDDL